MPKSGAFMIYPEPETRRRLEALHLTTKQNRSGLVCGLIDQAYAVAFGTIPAIDLLENLK